LNLAIDKKRSAWRQHKKRTT